MATKTIAFEGGEGSGKGTIIYLLSKYLKDKGNNVIVTREPGGTEIGEQIREVILNAKNKGMTGLAEALLFAASRTQLLSEIIQPELDKNESGYIILDRYVYSSYVYQGIVRGLGLEKVKRINDMATDEWHPEIVIYLDLEPEIGLSRIEQNNREKNRIDEEGLKFHKAIREGYLKIAKERTNFRTINANQSIEDVLKDVIKVIEE